ncbi:MAG: phosphoglycerate dehydrogenase [Provencibacterium sp.]|jgi:D-3-phosphoglycerate dehydrogenase|nr:phosphoglycerate dehydrogenase [Provencibacterium sp.]
MYQIKLLNKISPSGLDVFPKGQYAYSEECPAPDAIVVRSAKMHDYALEPSLRAIARAGAGVNNIPIERCSEKGVVVFNTPGANANAVKELTMTGLLLSARKVVPAIRWLDTLKEEGEAVPALVEKGKGKFAGPELKGKTLGVIGLGAIGVDVANTARHLGMKVYGYDPYMSVSAAWAISREIKHAASLQEIYENCDFISLHVPLTPETRGMVNTESMNTMRAGVRILNFARGELCVNEDLLSALEEGRIGCYVTDFPSAELIGARGVIAIPHLGASTPESEDNCARMAAQELCEYLENGNIRNSVNLPNLTMERSGKVRVGVIHRNIPNMISMIARVFSENTINIENMTNKSRGDYAYTVVDINSELPENLAASLEQIEGVIRVSVY